MMLERGKPIFDRRKESAKQGDPKSTPLGTRGWKSAILSAERERSVADAEAEAVKPNKPLGLPSNEPL